MKARLRRKRKPLLLLRITGTPLKKTFSSAHLPTSISKSNKKRFRRLLLQSLGDLGGRTMEQPQPQQVGVSWHLRYYENSYLVYVAFGTLVVSFFTVVYCCKVSCHFNHEALKAFTYGEDSVTRLVDFSPFGQLFQTNLAIVKFTLGQTLAT